MKIWPGRTIFTLFMAALVLSAIGTLPSGSCHVVLASDNVPTDFCYRQVLTITNNTGGTITNHPVRVLFNADTNISQGNLDGQAWDFVPVTSGNDEVEVMAQELDSTSSPWWVIIPSLADGATQNFNFYMGNDEAHRDNGMFFPSGGTDYATAADHADFDITDNLRIDVTLELVKEPTLNAIWLEHHNNVTSGYRVQFEFVSTVLNITFALGNGSSNINCRLPWDSDWNNERHKFSFEYTAATGNDAFIYVDDVLEKSCDTDAGSLGTTSNPLTIGVLAGSEGANAFTSAPLRNAVISYATIWSSGSAVARWDFDADNTTETSAVNPDYSGTITDMSGNSHDLTYNMTRSQTGITHSFGTVQLTSAPQIVEFGQETVDLLGDPLGGLDLGEESDPNTRLPGYSILQDAAESSGFPVKGFYVLIFTFLAVLTFGVLMAGGGNFWMAAAGASVWIVGAGIYDVYQPWVVVLWFAIVVMVFGAAKWAEN